ncbi:hypothetical protein LTR56_009676 [Elasticomyces elasticus]|nr:hypothetical protein LTR56_009676 [Elasticomyces elasticus]KAK3660176.1 hypothetical protein LTR22_008183 [Elasticomyces elasticus]KAK4923481.1 hypothetical protein LTR49_009355 [Elasticomyces elasticus]KAK5752440.1 hypothetical protein LTS12_017476 [Elasticomyces elasticus]
MELLASRVLAQQLYSQCRESADAYKPFSLSLKRLRNALEDIEDGVEDSTTSESYNARLNEQVERCLGILIQLDAAMRPQQDAAELQPPTAEAVLDLKTAIDVACHQLSVAYEAPSNLGSNIGGLQLRLQTNPGSTTTSSHAKSTSTSATSCDTRKLSTSSSTWSLVKPESSTGESIVYVASAATSPALTPMYKEEKQVCSTSGGLAPSRSPSAWASTFALDPLSIPMDEASAFILSDDSPTTSDRTYLSPTRPWSGSITTPLSDAKEAEVLATTESVEREHSAHSTTDQSQGLGISTKDPVQTKRIDAVEMHDEMISETHGAPSTPTNPTAPSPSFGDIKGGLSPIQNKTTLSSAKADHDRKSSPTPPARAPPPPPPSPKRPRNASISRYVITNTTHLDDEVTDDSDDETATGPTVRAPVPTEDIQIGYVALRSPSTSIPVVRVDDSACEAVPPEEQHQSASSHIAWASASLEQALTTPSEKEVLSNQSLTKTTNAKAPPLPQRPRRYKTVHSTQSASLSVLDSFITQALVDLEGNDRSHTDRKDHKLKQRKSVGDALNVCPSTNQNPSTRRWSWQRRSRSRSELDQTQMPPGPPQRQTSYSGSATLGMHSELEERCAKPLPPPPQRQRSHSGLAQLIRDEQAARAPAPVVPQRQRSHSGLAQLIRQDGRSSGLGMRPFMRSSSDMEREAPPPIPPRPAART